MNEAIHHKTKEEIEIDRLLLDMSKLLETKRGIQKKLGEMQTVYSDSENKTEQQLNKPADQAEMSRQISLLDSQISILANQLDDIQKFN